MALSSPSQIPGPYLRACDDGFNRYWKPLFIAIFRRFRPYREFIEQVRARGGLDSDLAFYLALPQRAQVQQAKAWGEERVSKIDRPLEELAKMKTKDWPFYAVFQKGIFRATASVWRHSVQKVSNGDEAGPFLDNWIGFLDKIYGEGLLEVQSALEKGWPGGLWLGIALNVGARTVKWNEATVERIHYVLLLWWYIHSNQLRVPKRFLNTVSKPKSNEKYPGAKDAVRELKKSLKSVVVGPEEEIPAEDILDARMTERLAVILDRVCRLTPVSSAQDEEEDGADGPGVEVSDGEPGAK